MSYFLKAERGAHAPEIDAGTEGETILDRGRHEGRRVVEVFVMHPDGRIDRYEERTRRRLGSNAISSRTWLCQTYHPGQLTPGAMTATSPNPEEEIHSTAPAPQAIVLVLTGAEGDSQTSWNRWSVSARARRPRLCNWPVAGRNPMSERYLPPAPSDVYIGKEPLVIVIPEPPRRTSHRPPIQARHYVASSGHYLATAAAMRIFG